MVINATNKSKLTTRPAYLKTGQAAAYLGLSRRYLCQLAAENQIRHSRIATRTQLFAIKDLDAFVQAHTTGGGQ
jgi:excisionase family DNA binding protein